MAVEGYALTVRRSQEMAESAIEILTRWEEHGATWRTRVLTDSEAVVELCSCYGEPIDELRSGEPELLRYLAARPRSDDDSGTPPSSQ